MAFPAAGITAPGQLVFHSYVEWNIDLFGFTERIVGHIIKFWNRCKFVHDSGHLEIHAVHAYAAADGILAAENPLIYFLAENDHSLQVSVRSIIPAAAIDEA